MKKTLLLYMIVSLFTLSLEDCKSKKIVCPTYGGPTGKRGAIPKATKTTSGVLPTDGRGTRTVLPH